MADKRLVIIGGGISGLIAAETFKRSGWNVTMIENGTLGGDFLLGGMQYIQCTSEFVDLANRLEIPSSIYQVRGGIYLHGTVIPYPQCFVDMSFSAISRTSRQFYKKTRGVYPDDSSVRSMDDAASVRPKKALRCNSMDLVSALSCKVDEIIVGAVTRVDHARKNVSVNRLDRSKMFVQYDALVIDIPLWEIKKIVSFNVPECMAMRLNVAVVTPRMDDYAEFDYVYTPYTPNNFAHRLSPHEEGYCVEGNGVLCWDDFISDLNFLFPNGYILNDAHAGLNGYLLPHDEEPDWPDDVRPIGRIATWDPKSTPDVDLSDSAKMVEGWK